MEIFDMAEVKGPTYGQLVVSARHMAVIREPQEGKILDKDWLAVALEADLTTIEFEWKQGGRARLVAQRDGLEAVGVVKAQFRVYRLAYNWGIVARATDVQQVLRCLKLADTVQYDRSYRVGCR